MKRRVLDLDDDVRSDDDGTWICWVMDGAKETVLEDDATFERVRGEEGAKAEEPMGWMVATTVARRSEGTLMGVVVVVGGFLKNADASKLCGLSCSSSCQSSS